MASDAMALSFGSSDEEEEDEEFVRSSDFQVEVEEEEEDSAEESPFESIEPSKPEFLEFTFCHYYTHGKYDESYRSVGNFLKFLQNEDVRSTSVHQIWKQLAPASSIGVDDARKQTSAFLYQCAQAYLKHLQLSEDWGRSYAYLKMFEESDGQWQYYCHAMCNLMHNQLLPSFSDTMEVIDREFPIWLEESKRHNEKLHEMMLDSSRGKEFVDYVLTHKFSFDVNLLWRDVIVLPKVANLQAFRCLLSNYSSALKVTDCDSCLLWTPMTVALRFNVTPLIECIDTHLRAIGSAEYRLSAAMQLARKTKRAEALAESSLKWLRIACKKKCEGGDRMKAEEMMAQTMWLLTDTIKSQIAEAVAFSHDNFTLVHNWQTAAASKKTKATGGSLQKGSRGSVDFEAEETKELIVFESDDDDDDTDSGAVVKALETVMSKTANVMTAVAGVFALIKPESAPQCSSEVMQALTEKTEGILKKGTLAENVKEWSFCKRVLLSTDSCLPVALQKKSGVFLQRVWQKSLERKKAELREAMYKYVGKAQSAYEELCGESLKSTPESARHKWRQDEWFKAEGFNQPVKDKGALERVSFGSTSTNFDAKEAYDFGTYLCSLLTDAHIIEPEFRREMQRISETSDVLKRAQLHFTLVNDAIGCKEKVEKQKSLQWPKTATLKDLVRCSLSFDSFGELVAGVKTFRDDVCDKHLGVSNIFEIVGIENGFDKYATDLQVPDEYCDLTVNVAIRSTAANGRKVALIGEVRFVLRPLLEFAKENKELLQMSRSENGLLSDARNAYESQFTKALPILRAAYDSQQMAQVLVHYSDTDAFNQPPVLEELLQILAIGVGYKKSLFEFVCHKYMLATVDSPRFADTFMATFVAQRSREKDLYFWLTKLKRLCGEKRFKELLTFRNAKGMCPLMTYLSSLQQTDDFKFEVADILIPESMEFAEEYEFWEGTCVDFADRNVVRLAADQCAIGCLRANEVLEYLKQTCGNARYQSLVQSSDKRGAIHSPLLGVLLNLPAHASVSEELLSYLMPIKVTKAAKNKFLHNASVDKNGYTLAHAVALSAAKYGHGVDEVLFKVKAVIGPSAFWLMSAKKKPDASVFSVRRTELRPTRVPPVVDYLRHCKTEDAFNAEVFRALTPEIPKRSASKFWTKRCVEESRNILHICCVAAADNKYSPLRALAVIKSTVGHSVFTKLLEQRSKDSSRTPLADFVLNYKGMEPFSEDVFRALVPDSAVCTAEIGEAIDTKPKVEDICISFWGAKEGLNMASCLAQTAGRNSISPTTLLTYLKNACGPMIFPKLLRTKGTAADFAPLDNGDTGIGHLNPLAVYIRCCRVGTDEGFGFGEYTKDGSDDADSACLVWAVPRQMPSFVTCAHLRVFIPPFDEKDTDEKKEDEIKEDTKESGDTEEETYSLAKFLSESCTSEMGGTLLHLCALKYAMDGIKNVSLLKNLRALLGDEYYDGCLVTEHRFSQQTKFGIERSVEIPAMLYARMCVSEPTFDEDVLRAFVALTTKQYAIDKKTFFWTKMDPIEFWTQKCLDKQRRNILHVIGDTAAEKYFSPVRRIQVLKQLCGGSVLKALAMQRSKYDKTPLMEYLFKCKSAASLSSDSLALLTPAKMSAEECAHFFTKTCVSYVGSNVLLTIAGICAVNGIRVAPILAFFRKMCGEALLRKLLSAKDRENMSALMFYCSLCTKTSLSRVGDENTLALISAGMNPAEMGAFLHDCIDTLDCVQLTGFIECMRQRVGYSEMDSVLRTSLDSSGHSHAMHLIANCRTHFGDALFVEELFMTLIPKKMTKSEAKDYWLLKAMHGWNIYDLAQRSNNQLVIFGTLQRAVNDNSLFSQLIVDSAPRLEGDTSQMIEVITGKQMLAETKKAVAGMSGLKTEPTTDSRIGATVEPRMDLMPEPRTERIAERRTAPRVEPRVAQMLAPEMDADTATFVQEMVGFGIDADIVRVTLSECSGNTEVAKAILTADFLS